MFAHFQSVYVDVLAVLGSNECVEITRIDRPTLVEGVAGILADQSFPPFVFVCSSSWCVEASVQVGRSVWGQAGRETGSPDPCGLRLLCGLFAALCGHLRRLCGHLRPLCGFFAAICGFFAAIHRLFAAICGLVAAICGFFAAICGIPIHIFWYVCRISCVMKPKSRFETQGVM